MVDNGFCGTGGKSYLLELIKSDGSFLVCLTRLSRQLCLCFIDFSET